MNFVVNFLAGVGTIAILAVLLRYAYWCEAWNGLLHRIVGHFKKEEPENWPILKRYIEGAGYGPNDQPWVKITGITVETEYDKEQVVAALEYLHYGDIDTDYIAVNTLVHLYENPELIEVKPANG